MDVLRIKCPSCGIILEVRNSRNESVKRIACPNCKKQLAVSFQHQPASSPYVDIKKVQLADGSTKTIVRALTADHVVKINGKALQQGDEVVLRAGDELQVDEISKETPTPAPQPPVPSHSGNHWLYYAVSLVAVLVLAVVFWKQAPRPQTPSEKNVPSDTIPAETVEKLAEQKADPPTPPATKQRKVKKPDKAKPTQEETTLSGMSNYALELKAKDGNVEAQYLLGKRWVGSRDSIGIVKGIQYLKLAARNGSSEAKNTLRVVYTGLQQAAAGGNSVAANILREQR